MFRILTLLCLLITFSFAQAQEEQAQEEKTFTLSDTEFERGSILRTYDLNFAEQKAYIDELSFPLMDSLSQFLLANEHLLVEIGVHFEFGYVKSYEVNSYKLDQERARQIRTYFVHQGISKQRLSPVGYAYYEPLISKSELKKLSTEEQSKAALQNRRVEFKITGILPRK